MRFFQPGIFPPAASFVDSHPWARLASRISSTLIFGGEARHGSANGMLNANFELSTKVLWNIIYLTRSAECLLMTRSRIRRAEEITGRQPSDSVRCEILSGLQSSEPIPDSNSLKNSLVITASMKY